MAGALEQSRYCLEDGAAWIDHDDAHGNSAILSRGAV
jgi:hypothetical protein